MKRRFQHHLTRRQWLGQGAALLGASSVGTSALAQPSLSAPMRILVGASPDGSTDTLARAVGAEMGRLLGRQAIVENRAGAGGNLAADLVAKAAPDGSTLLMSFTSHAINASLYPS
jgi:tripartite-type tricarboxylate transporter receptor subunit TctC